MAGKKDTKVIVAIKRGQKESKAPIFGVIDYRLEADLFATVPKPVATL